MISRRNFLTTSAAIGAVAALPVLGEASQINRPATVTANRSFHVHLLALDTPAIKGGFIFPRDEVRTAVEKMKEPVEVRFSTVVQGLNNMLLGTAIFYIPPDGNDLWAEVTFLEGPQAQLIQGRKQQQLEFVPDWKALATPTLEGRRLWSIKFRSLWLFL